ncbi:ABC transporter permease [bacterium]|nr:ABC transporter permease [bacterium]
MKSLLSRLQDMLPPGRGSALGINSLLGVLGVAIGVANIIALISVTQSGDYQASGNLRDAGSDTVFVFPFVDTGDGMQRSNANAWLPAGYEEAARTLPEVDAVASVLMMPGHMGHGAQRVFTTIQGVSGEYLSVRGHAMERGRFFTVEETRQGADLCCIGSQVPGLLFPDGEDPMGKEIVVKGRKFTVIGIMVEKGMMGFETIDNRVFLPITTARELYKLDGSSSLLIRAAKGTEPSVTRKAVIRELRKVAGLGKGEPSDFTVTTVEQLTKIVASMLKVFNYLLYGVGSVALIVAGIGIMNVMLMQIIERTREIGVRRALGARRRDIWRQFLTEAILQSVFGAILGTGLGIAATATFCAMVQWKTFVAPQTVLMASAFSLIVGLLFGLYPAAHAAQLKPIDCLRYE